ncbi:leucine-rich repeat domain-containing protein [Clostridium septicum]|nr:leucine-rich repeat domain-containing protein [Clostridium septicum]UEC21515.1 leucine-rich repeat domain-containing protein [Clostridium septicum]USS00438.1 leucine-rich repeat domain-containing protein [Clostridium septicum]WLF68985.1 leucine-rich repeat domain-containing protein [Clostridium septicum]
MKKKLAISIISTSIIFINILLSTKISADNLNLKENFGQATGDIVNAVSEDGYVDIPDITLRKSLNKALNQNEDDKISKRKLEKLTKFYSMFGEVSNLEGIQYCTNLRELNLQVNKIKDITLLENLTKLRSLSLNVNEIEDISPLSELKELRELYIGYNQIKDLTPLSNLENLKELSIGKLPIDNIEAIKNKPYLMHLSLDSNKLKDLTPIRTLKDLRSISISSSNVENIEFLKDLETVTWVDLHNNNINDITVLKTLPNLSGAVLNDNNIADISPLKDLQDLELVYVDNNNIADITPLKDLTNLKRIKVDNQKVILSSKEVNGRVVIKNPLKHMNGYGKVKGLDNNGEVNESNTYISWNNIKDDTIKNLSFDFNEEVTLGREEIPFSGKVIQPVKFNSNAIKLEDINKNSVVDIDDMAIIASKYNKKHSDENWNEDFDLNKDSIIDILDLVIVSKSM